MRTGNINRGFSLIEVLVALLIMSVAMLAVMTLFTQSIAARRMDLQQQQAARRTADEAEIKAMETAARLHTAPAP